MFKNISIIGDGGKKIKRAGYQGIKLSADYIQRNLRE